MLAGRRTKVGALRYLKRYGHRTPQWHRHKLAPRVMFTSFCTRASRDDAASASLTPSWESDTTPSPDSLIRSYLDIGFTVSLAIRGNAEASGLFSLPWGYSLFMASRRQGHARGAVGGINTSGCVPVREFLLPRRFGARLWMASAFRCADGPFEAAGLFSIDYVGSCPKLFCRRALFDFAQLVWPYILGNVEICEITVKI